MRAGRRAGLLAATLGLLFGTASCSFIVDKNADQCASNDDCSAVGVGLVCSEQKVCVSGSAGGECTTNAECLAKGANQICRKSDFTCVSLTSPECTTIIGDPARDDAFMFGSVLPTTGLDEALGKPVELAIELAMRQIESELSGIPVSAGVVRPFLYIGCDDKSDLENTTALEAAKHLALTVQVPAIIGEAFSGSTIAIANGVTIKNNTLLISPAATSDTITSIPDNNLLWRTSPPDVLQAAALKRYVPEVEQLVRKDIMDQGMNPETFVRIAVIHNSDSYGKGLAGALETGDMKDPPLQLNGKNATSTENESFYSRTQYDEQDTAAQAAVAKDMALSFKPHIVLLFGFTEAIEIYKAIEKDWMGGPVRPRYVMSDAILGSALLEAISANDSLRKRTSGTVPGTQNALFDSFVNTYGFQWKNDATKYPASTFGAAGGYDAVFLLAYSTATLAPAGLEETGPGLAAGLKKLSDPMGITIEAGAAGMSKGMTELSQGKSINYSGASGPLDFDPETGEAQSDIQIWCITSSMGVAASGENSGYFYSATSKQLAGEVKPGCGWGTTP